MLNDLPKIGLGCMNLSHAYGQPPSPEAGERLIQQAFDWGVRHFDTAILYGFGKNEELVGRAIKPFRNQVHLASKCGLTTPEPNMKRQIDGRPESIKRACHESLRRLQTDVIDLYYLHRLDKAVPIEESVGALADLVLAGKIKSIGLSEVSAQTIRRAHKVHPLAAVQTEYSLWTRNPEIAVLDACRELDIAFIAFSPLARGFLTGTLTDPHNFPEKDIRLAMPRFQAPHYPKNLELLAELRQVADDKNCTMGQLALAWLLHQKGRNKNSRIIAIPGTTNSKHLKENLGAVHIELSARDFACLNEHFDPRFISGPRYNARTQQEIDTEEW